MFKKVFRLIARLAILGSLMYLARSALKRWVDGPDPLPGGTGSSWAPVPEAPRVTPPSDPVPARADPAGPDAVSEGAGSPAPATQGRSSSSDGATRQSSAPRRPDQTEAQAGGAWIAPDDSGNAPSTHPVKAKLSSRTYREPGSSGYEKARPDRCYVSAEAAEADGFNRAKR